MSTTRARAPPASTIDSGFPAAGTLNHYFKEKTDGVRSDEQREDSELARSEGDDQAGPRRRGECFRDHAQEGRARGAGNVPHRACGGRCVGRWALAKPG